MSGVEVLIAGSLFDLLFDSAVSQIWPLLLYPALAALVSDRLARKLPSTRTDWRTAAALAALPGLVMVALISMIAGRAASHLHADDYLHFIKYHVPLALAVALIGRAALRLHGRNSAVRKLMELAHAPSPRLQQAAELASVAVREIDDDSCECFVAGILRPTAYVSQGVLQRMRDDELVAALHHERAHARSHDPAMLALLSFLADLAPGTDRALTLYRQARERSADAEAAHRAGPCALASALLAMARQSPAPAAAFGMSASDANSWRLQAILGVEPDHGCLVPAVRLWPGIAFNLALTLWPLPHVYLVYRFC